jgi:hypothetical protein
LKANNPLETTFGNCLELKDVVVDSRHAGVDFLDVDARVVNRLTDRHLSQFPKSLFNPSGTTWGHARAYYGYVLHWIAPDLFFYFPERPDGCESAQCFPTILQRSVW